jgi:phage terminase large subunit
MDRNDLLNIKLKKKEKKSKKLLSIRKQKKSKKNLVYNSFFWLSNEMETVLGNFSNSSFIL